MEDSTPTPTEKLLDLEESQEKERRERMGKVTLEIEQILLRENMTVGDFLEIVGLFTGRANDVFSRITIKEVKEKYGSA